jgi:hypothetical protein
MAQAILILAFSFSSELTAVIFHPDPTWPEIAALAITWLPVLIVSAAIFRLGPPD